MPVMKPDDPPVVVEHEFAVPVADLWSAITEPARMRDWFFAEMEDFQPEVGFQTSFAIEYEGTTYQHCWKLVEVVANEKIVYDWRYKDCSGIGIVTWELESTENGSKLRVTNSVTEEFPADDPAFHREAAEAGWNFLITDSLASYLTEPESED